MHPGQEFFSQLTSLKQLNVFHLAFGWPAVSVEKIVPYLTPCALSLRTLTLGNAEFQANDTEHFAVFKNLEALGFQDSNLSQAHLDRICEALCDSLEELDLSGAGRISSLRKIALCTRLKDLAVQQQSGLLGADELQHLTGLEKLVLIFSLFSFFFYSNIRSIVWSFFVFFYCSKLYGFQPGRYRAYGTQHLRTALHT